MKQHPVTLHSSEATAILAGRQTQLRIPAPRYQLKPGDLLWAREAFVEFVGWRKGAHLRPGIDYGTLGTGARCPDHLRGREYKVYHRGPKGMDRKQSRLTLEVISATVEGDAVAITFRAHPQSVLDVVAERNAEHGANAVAAEALR